MSWWLCPECLNAWEREGEWLDANDYTLPRGRHWADSEARKSCDGELVLVAEVRSEQLVGYEACWEPGPNGTHCRMPKGHAHTEHAFS